LFGLHLALHEAPQFSAAAFDPNINRTLKWSIGADTMEELFSAHEDVKANRVPRIVQFGSGPLSVIDPTQAPPGKHTTYCWHVMPFEPDLGGQNFEDFKREFADKIVETFARYCPNMRRANIIGQYVYTAKEYTAELINMRRGDIFMGAFNASRSCTTTSAIARRFRICIWRARPAIPAARSPAARLHQRRHYCPRSRPKIMVEACRRERRAWRAGAGGVMMRDTASSPLVPAEAGTQQMIWIPACAGMSGS